MKVNILSDIHGNTHYLDRLARKTDDLIIQIGDFGFANDWKVLSNYSPDKVKVVGGNHDEYPIVNQYPHYLGDYGLIPGFDMKVGFLRGAYSIDRYCRIEGISWWPEEQISYPDLWKFLDWYEIEKPDVMITHCSTITGLHRCVHPVFSYSRTETVLEEAFKIHPPKIHVHGHLHVSKKYDVGKTKCICLNVHESREFDW